MAVRFRLVRTFGVCAEFSSLDGGPGVPEAIAELAASTAGVGPSIASESVANQADYALSSFAEQ